METLEKSPESGSLTEKPISTDKKDQKAEKKEAPKKADKPERPKLFADQERTSPEKSSPYALFEQKADKEPPLLELDKDERTLVVADQVEHNLSAANAELTIANTAPAEAAAIAGATYNEAVKERLENGDQPTAEMLDGAMNDTADILGLDGKEINESVPTIVVPDSKIDDPLSPREETSDDLEIPLDTDAEQEETGQLDGNEAPVPAETIDVPEDDEPATPPPAGPPPDGLPPPGNSFPPGSGGPGGFNMPPNIVQALNGAPWLNPNVAGNLANKTVDSQPGRHSHWPYVLVGGVVGYFIGRRRGRIKTEKKLLPVQKKLEQQVGDLQYQVAAREAKIRKLAYEKAITHPNIHAALPTRLKELQELQKASLKKKDFEHTPETHSLSKKQRTEKVVAALASAELLKKTAARIEHDQSHDPIQDKPKMTETTAKQSEAILAEKPRAVADMTTAELLIIAGQLPVAESNARRLFETGRLNETGLRRVVKAYLRGERYDKVLYETMRTGDGIEISLPSFTSNQISNSSAVEQALHDKVSSQLLEDPQLSMARQEYYQLLEQNDERVAVHKTGQTILVTVGVIVVASLLFLVFH